MAEKTVKMRTNKTAAGVRWLWWWDAYLGGTWLGCMKSSITAPYAKRSGNAWAKRMNLTPEWE